MLSAWLDRHAHACMHASECHKVLRRVALHVALVMLSASPALLCTGMHMCRKAAYLHDFIKGELHAVPQRLGTQSATTPALVHVLN